MSFRIWKYILPFRRIHEWWSNKSPAEKWESIIGIAKTFGNLVGVRVFSDLRLYWYSASPGVCIGIFYLLNLYTIQYYLRRGSFVRGMECTYLIGAVVGVREVICFFFELKSEFTFTQNFRFNSRRICSCIGKR